ncbi:hypothetical protein Tco_0624221 [Tanacetum coccineum]|uniref:Uncharacterized protein n=1 Tax=Tanacetum coccineum TaxID=301880 RepID=A0ABQ4WDB5_9ASTR
MMIQEPSDGRPVGQNEGRSGKETEYTSASKRKDHPRQLDNTTTGYKSHKAIASNLLTSRHVIPFHHFINNDLEYLRGGESSCKYSTSVTKTKAGISHWGKKQRQYYVFASTRESAHDVYSKRRIIAVTKVEIVKWQNYKHLDWITIRRDDDNLYKFKGSYKAVRLRFSDPMIQPEPEGSTQGYPLVSVEVLSHGPSDAMHNPLPATQSQKDFVSKLTEIHSFLLTFSLRNIRVNSFTMKMEILLESTSNKLMVGNGSTVVDPHGSEGLFKNGGGGPDYQLSPTNP